MSKSILILDESRDDAQLIKNVLEATDFGYQCETIDSFENFQQLLKSKKIDVALIDKDFPEEGIYRKIKKCKLDHRNVRMIMLADHLEEKDMRLAQEHFIEGFCQKTDDYPTLINSIEQVID